MKKQIIIYGIIGLLSAGLFIIARVYADGHRSGDGIGGEFLIPLLPLLIWIGVKNVKTWIENKAFEVDTYKRLEEINLSKL